MSLKLHFKRNFIAGLVTLLPLWITVLILWVIFNWVSSVSMPVLLPAAKHFFGKSWSGLVQIVSFFLTIFVIWLVGILTTLIISKRFLLWIESLLAKIPLLNSIYAALRKLTQYIFRAEDRGFKSVCLVEFPKPGSHVIGFVIGNCTFGKKDRKVKVFIPHAPNPTTGFLLFVREKEIRHLDISFDNALRAIISGGIVMPESLNMVKREKITEVELGGMER